jgi:hypothetical protein
MREITDERLEKYFKITKEALDAAKKAPKNDDLADVFIDMASRYYSDAEHFKEKGDYVLAFGALNYAHGWLDAGARAGFFKVNDSRLFTVDDERVD